MSEPIQFLTQHGPMLIMGITALLLVGAMATAVLRSPVHRLRVCELSVLATLAWVVLACIPLPRLTWHTPNIPHTFATVPAFSSGPQPAIAPVDIPPELIAKPQPPSKLFVTATHLNNVTIAPPINHSREIATAFLIGAGACIAWLMLGHYLLWRMIRRSSAAPDHVTKMVTSQLGQKQRTPRVLIAPGLARPVTCGTRRPLILLPASLLHDDCQTQLRQVLLHELGHIQQGDGWGSLLFNLALPLLYFHPLYWILRRCAGLSRELVADDWAARADGKETYVTQLISLARTRAAITVSPVGTIGILQTRSHFYRRMHMLLQRHQPLATRCSATCRAALVVTALAAIACSASILGVRPAMAQVGSTTAPADGATDSTGKKADIAETLNARMNSLLLERQRIEADLANRRAAGAPPEEIANVQVLVDTLQKEFDGVRQASSELKTLRSGDGDIEKRTRDAKQAISELSVNQIGMIDQNMHHLLTDQTQLQAQMANLKNGGRLPGNATVTTLQAALDEQQKKIDSYAVEWRDLQIKMGRGSLLAQTPDPRVSTPAANSTPIDTGKVGGVQLDLISLANTMVDTSGAVRLAKANYDRIAALGKTEAVSRQEIDTAKVNLETSEKRLRLLRGIAEIALEGAQTDFDRAQKMQAQGLETAQSATDAKTKMQILKMILSNAN